MPVRDDACAVEVTKRLKEEHRLIERILAALTSSAKQQLHECDDYADDDRFDPKLFRQGMDLIMDFGIKCHMKKEDILIYEINGRAKKDIAIVEHLLEEHNYIGMFMNSISRAIDVLSMGGSGEEKRKGRLETLRNFMEYSELVRHYMSMVDGKLFPMCEKAFSDKEKKVLLEKFKEVDGACNRAKLGRTSSEVKKLEGQQTKTHLFPEKTNTQIWHHLHKNSKTSIGS